jgi:hypothetical protein
VQGVIFGTAQGTIITSLSGTIAAAIAFLIARYAMRDKVRHAVFKGGQQMWVEGFCTNADVHPHTVETKTAGSQVCRAQPKVPGH